MVAQPHFLRSTRTYINTWQRRLGHGPTFSKCSPNKNDAHDSDHNENSDTAKYADGLEQNRCGSRSPRLHDGKVLVEKRLCTSATCDWKSSCRNRGGSGMRRRSAWRAHAALRRAAGMPRIASPDNAGLTAGPACRRRGAPTCCACLHARRRCAMVVDRKHTPKLAGCRPRLCAAMPAQKMRR